MKYCHVRWHAERRGIPFSLSREAHNQIVNGFCIYGGKGIADGIRISVERLDNNKGYTDANCVPSCFRHNSKRLNDFTHEEFLDAVERYPGLAACGNIQRKAKNKKARESDGSI